jgi:hypothetical protein
MSDTPQETPQTQDTQEETTTEGKIKFSDLPKALLTMERPEWDWGKLNPDRKDLQS